MIQFVGSLPVSAINTGLVAGVSGIAIEVSKLTADISRLQTAIISQTNITAQFPPNPASYAAVTAVRLSPTELASAFAPGNFTVGAADLVIDIAADAAIVEGQIAAASEVTGSISAGLAAGGIAGWTYAGRAASFGKRLATRTANGFGATRPDAQISAVIIATESFASWGAFSQGARAGALNAPASTMDEKLAFQGELSAGQWNTGAADILGRLNLFLAELEGQKAALEVQAQLAIGANLPDPSVVIDAGLAVVADIGIDGLLDNLVSGQVDFTAGIGEIQAKIDALAALTTELNAQLSAGGLAFWTYSGRADQLGAEFQEQIADGIPGGLGPSSVAYGLVLAGTPATMSTFGSIFKTS